MSQVKTSCGRKAFMANLIFALLTVTFFCVCCHQFIRVILQPVSRLRNPQYTMLALRLRKNYQVFSWGVMTFSFLAGLVISFYQVYSQL